MAEVFEDDEIHRTGINTHITALKLYKQFLLIAESNEVQIYDWIHKIFIHRETIFDNCSIHGIRTDDDSNILFFGAKSVKIFSISHSSENWKLEELQAFNLKDWILDVQWLNIGEKTSNIIAAITAHNCLIIYSLTEGIIETVQCAENCILYSASIISTQLNDIVVAVGTVFKQILLWSPNSKPSENCRTTPFHILTGHQGVIFSIIYNKTNHIICSTSDDRSLRVWKIESNVKEENALIFWKNSVITVIHVLFAHESRVWRAAILNTYILSIGEDSFLCVWNLNGELLRKIKCHKGGSIWCLETGNLSSSIQKDSSTDDESIYAFTGGSDGGVYKWNISMAANTEAISQVHLKNNITDVSFIKDFPRACALLTDDVVENFIVSTDKGRTALYNMNSKKWQDIFYEDSFASYCLVSVSKRQNFLALLNMVGELVLGKLKNGSVEKCVFQKFKIHDRKTCSIHWTNIKTDNFLSCSTEGHMALWQITYDNEFSIHLLHRFFLPKCKNHWWSTTALFLNNHDILIVGDRSGTLSVYNTLNNIDNIDVLDQPIMQIKYIHGDNGVTDIQEHSSFIYSAGRDGKINQFHIVNGVLKLLHCIKVSHDLEWIGKILFYESHLLLLGFRTKDFVVWSTQLESAIMTVECGGGHRSWDFHLTEEGVATYIAIKKKEIIYYQKELNPFLKDSIIKAGISGQKFSCLTYLFTKPYKNSGSISVVACGGEDTAVKILGIINLSNTPSISTLYSLSGHLSSIRAIAKLKMHQKDSWLLASVGGRAQIMIWKLESIVGSEKNYIGTKCEELISEILTISESKIKIKKKENKTINIVPQTRLMDVSIKHSATSQAEAEMFSIGVACSDSYFRLYKLDINRKELLLIHILKHGENCILKLRSIFFKTGFNNILYITGTTNGALQIWNNKENISDSHANILSDVSPKDLHRSHQSGINALDVKLITGSKWMICSAGDDNSLMIAFVNLDTMAENSLKVNICSKHHELLAHASQITGVKILDEHTVVTASVDQRINVWKINYKNLAKPIILYTSKISLVPDIANIESWLNGNSCWTIAVCGQGIEIFTVHIKLDYKSAIAVFY